MYAKIKKDCVKVEANVFLKQILPVCYFHNQIGIVYNGWIFSKFMVGDDMLHKLF